MNAKRLSIFFVSLLTVLVACGPAATPMPQGTAQAGPVESAGEATAAAEPAFAPAPTEAALLEGASALAVARAAGQMVIKDAEIELIVDDTDRALARTTQMAADHGGYVVSSQTWYADGFKHASLRLGIPSTEFEPVLNELRLIGLRVVRETAAGQDVSAEYTDLQSRLTNLEATAARVRSFLDDAKTVEESLNINRQLQELESQIEQVKGQMNYYRGRAAFSTVTVDLTPDRPTPTPTPTATPGPGWSPATTFHSATDVLGVAARGLVDVLIWLLVLLGPVVLIGGVVLGVGRWLFRDRPE